MVTDMILFSARIPTDLRNRIAALAAKEGRMIQRQAAMVIELGLERAESGERPASEKARPIEGA